MTAREKLLAKEEQALKLRNKDLLTAEQYQKIMSNLSDEAAKADRQKGQEAFERSLPAIGKYYKDMLELRRLLSVGAIDQKTFDRENARLLGEWNSGRGGKAVQFAEGGLVGSESWWKSVMTAIYGQQNKTTAELQKEANAELKQQTVLLDQIKQNTREKWQREGLQPLEL